MKSIVAFLIALAALPCFAADDDPFLWLEEIDGQKPIAWVKEHNARTVAELGKVKEYAPILARTQQILDSKERIPMPSVNGQLVYNFWQDQSHERGIWRRTTLESYRTAAPAWETVVDVDALAKAENVPWSWKGANCLPPDYRQCMVALSRGGGDAVVYRELDAATKQFVDGGFSLPEAKSRVAWHDKDTLWVGTDFGPGSKTNSGYPRIVKLWKRGTPLASAQTVFEGKAEDVSSAGHTLFTPEGPYHLVTRMPAFFRQETFLRLGDRLVKLDLPEDSNFEGIWRERLLVSLRTSWAVGGKTYPADALLSIGLDDFLRGGRGFEMLFEPSERVSFGGVAETRTQLLLQTLDNVRSRLYTLTPGSTGWQREEIPLPGLGTAGVVDSGNDQDVFFYAYRDFLTPASLFLSTGAKGEKLKSAPSFFSADGVKVEQHEATSKDGTKIPYFLVMPKGFVADGKAPTLLYGYGGFEIPEVPNYNGVLGSAWIERGGVYALANLRGGGEFGPAWHKAAQKHNRIKCYEDFIAVAEDLIARKVTSTKHLGIMGGSQGGLLVGGTYALRPDLFGAVVCQVPLADMKRYHKLLAGASWMAEYGDPDNPEDWAAISKYSPYQLLRKDVTYPKVFFWTTTRDDRVHPGHARKMVAKMESLGHPVYYFENIEGGHGSGTTNKQRAQITALEYVYLWKMLR